VLNKQNQDFILDLPLSNSLFRTTYVNNLNSKNRNSNLN